MNRVDHSGDTSQFGSQQANAASPRELARRTAIVFLPVMGLAVAVAWAVLAAGGSAKTDALRETERHAVGVLASSIGSDIEQVTSDLRILASQGELTDVWRRDGRTNPEAIAELTQECLLFSSHRKLYDQIRVLDESGMEILRINYNDGRPAVVPQERLQNKKGRYYFDDAFALAPGEVFVSPLDLNIEHGQIEHPLKPMLRFATPVSDAQGRKRGIVLLNYLGRRMLGRFSGQATTLSRGVGMLLNPNGYWLAGENAEDEWAFMYPDRGERTFANRYPEEWERIKVSSVCQFETPLGMFTSETVRPLLDGQISSTGSGKAFSPSLARLGPEEFAWEVVVFTPRDILYAEHRRQSRYAGIALILLCAPVLLGAWRLAKAALLQEHTEDALRRAKSRMERIMNSVQSGLAIIDAETHAIVQINPAGAAMIGVEPGEAVGRRCRGVLCPEEQCLCPLTDDEEQAGGLETTFVTGRGTKVDVLKTTTLTELEGRKCLIASFIDISDRKRGERERERHSKTDSGRRANWKRSGNSPEA